MPLIAEQPPKVVAIPAIVPAPIVHPRRHFKLKWIFWICLAILLAAGGLYWRSYSQNKISFDTTPIERGSIQSTITATGTLNPVVNVQVSSQVSGNIKALYADFNTKVTKGQLVALIDPQIFQAQVDQASGAAGAARAAVVTAQAQVEKARAELAGAVANKDNLQAVLAKDKASALNAKIQFERSDSLFAKGIVSQQEHDTAKANYDAYEAQLTADQSQIAAAEENIRSAQSQINVVLRQLEATQAQQRQSEAVLAQAMINLGHTRILAPVSGTVIARHFDVGQTVAASFQAPDIFDIAQDLTKMQVDTNVDESDVGTIRAGQPATFTVDAYPDTTFRAVVVDVRKAPIIQQNVVTYDVVIGVSNPEVKLFPGMTANVSILTARQEDVLKVANAALRFHPAADLLKQAGVSPPKGGGAQIYLLREGKLTAIPIKLGLSDGRSTAITGSGLKPGDAAVIRAITSKASSTSNSATAPSPQRGPRI
ncbi:MAG: efflux RND transporter periplasmic adaptor subunit [Acidobacteriia bacterium]|nr:efflux RND transporter periplasmic adaptor subunit [Terriglobia bacterium]